MTYEEFINGRNMLAENMKNNITKEEYEEIVRISKEIKEFESKIDKLASSYNDNKILGYYIIIEHCLEQIKINDKNLNNNFIGNSNNKKT